MTIERPSDRRPPDDEVLAFLRSHHDRDVDDLEVLSGGFWSAAYGYRVGDVARFVKDQVRAAG